MRSGRRGPAAPLSKLRFTGNAAGLAEELCNVDVEGLFFKDPTLLAGRLSCEPLDMILCGLSGLVLADASRLGLRECCMPCTMDVWRW